MTGKHIRMAERNIRVAVADDHPVVVLAIIDAIESMLGFSVVARAHSGADLVKAIESQPVDLIVTDLVMNGDETGLDGLRLIDKLRRDFPDIPIVVFTMLKSGAMFQELSKRGVAAIIGKEEDVSELGKICARALVGKELTLSPRIHERIAKEGATKQDFARAQPLSPKELEVVRLFSQGLSVTEIAKSLNRAVPTIATQKRAAMRKLHIDNHADLVKYATEHGLA